MEDAKLILVVDDEPRMRRFMQMNLDLEGYRVIEAGNGLEALNRVRENLPNMVLLDVMMPEMDGFAACAKLKSSPQSEGIPVILLTGVAKYISRSKYPLDGVLRAEAEEYLEKPLEPEALLKAVAAHVK